MSVPKGKGGRPMDPIWSHYIQKEINNKLIVECINCKKIVSAKPYRMKVHWIKCKGGGCNFESHPTDGLEIDNEELSCFSQVNLVPPAKKLNVEKESETERNVLDLEDRPITVTTQTSMKRFIMKTTAKEKHNLDVAVAKFFYACNIPFSVSEHPAFKNMISSLRPGYKPPNSKQLAENLLDKVHIELKSKVEEEVQQCENLQIALHPNICNFVRNHTPPNTNDESELIIESSVIKSEPLSDYEDLTNGIDLSESSNDACSSSSFGNLEIVVKQEDEDS